VLDRSPPALFKQGVTAFVKLLICAGLSFFLMTVDGTLRIGEPIRLGLATALYPVQWALGQPIVALTWLKQYLEDVNTLKTRQTQLEADLLRVAETAQQAHYLAIENQQLRELLQLRATQQNPSVVARIIGETPDPYQHRVRLDKGTADGIVAGSAGIDAMGVFGQVTRAYLLNSEVTLVTDRRHATPVMNTRTGQRSVLFGSKSGRGDSLELRYVDSNADIQVGDVLSTSGIDGVYPAGLPVAVVTDLPSYDDNNYATIQCQPLARLQQVLDVLVVAPTVSVAPMTPNAPEPSPPGAAPTKTPAPGTPKATP